MKIKIARGTNPKISFKLKNCPLVADKDSYVTIRRNLQDREVAIDSTIGEVQIPFKDFEEGEEKKVTDDYGNVFEITENTASISLSRISTQKMEYGIYFLQFNLKDNEGRLFTHKPYCIEVQINLTDFPEA